MTEEHPITPANERVRARGYILHLIQNVRKRKYTVVTPQDLLRIQRKVPGMSMYDLTRMVRENGADLGFSKRKP